MAHGVFLQMPVIGTGTGNDPRRPKYSSLIEAGGFSWVAVDAGSTMFVYTDATGATLASVVVQPDVVVIAAPPAARPAIVAAQPLLAGRPVILGLGSDMLEF